MIINGTERPDLNVDSAIQIVSGSSGGNIEEVWKERKPASVCQFHCFKKLLPMPAITVCRHQSPSSSSAFQDSLIVLSLQVASRAVNDKLGCTMGSCFSETSMYRVLH